MNHLYFHSNETITLGVELELQLVDLQHFNLAVEAKDFLRRVEEVPHTGKIKPEITQAMIELNSSVHSSYASLVIELENLRDLIAREAHQTHIGVCGGGAHPFQQWKHQRIFPTERFASISEQYGYLAKQFTVFGQHIHVGCRNGDDAIYLCHALAQYLPHFIALSAASPFQQGVDTSFDCSRLAVVSAFPLSGTPPWLLTWHEFEAYYHKMFELGILKSIKDIYWDIRPKAEFGTIEIRICDTPLTVQKAAQLGAYAQLLVAWLLDKRPDLSKEIYTTYLINRFRAARYGLEAICIDPIHGTHTSIAESILTVGEQLNPYARELDARDALQAIMHSAREHQNDARWLRNNYNVYQSFNDTVRSQTELWCS